VSPNDGIPLIGSGEPLRDRAKRAQDALERETGERATGRQALFLTGAPVLGGLWKPGGSPPPESPSWRRRRR
jgi:hypothetical protein